MRTLVLPLILTPAMSSAVPSNSGGEKVHSDMSWSCDGESTEGYIMPLGSVGKGGISKSPCGNSPPSRKLRT